MNMTIKTSHDVTLKNLTKIGWTDYFEAQFRVFSNRDLVPKRVVGVRKNHFRVSDGDHEHLSSLAGRIFHDPAQTMPVAGDWVLVRDGVIYKVLVRKNALSRGASGTRNTQAEVALKEQVIAANLDTVFIVCGLDRDFNVRRIERYLTLVYNCGLDPVIVLSKADLHHDPEPYKHDVETIAFGVPVCLVAAGNDEGLKDLLPYLSPGRTVTLLGSSGAGKSTLVNRLYGKNVQQTSTVSASVGKGRHTTTSRDLVFLPDGGMVIDNPGIREIAFWDDDDGVDSAFPDIEIHAEHCRFSDCSHTTEPGCRVLQAVENGDILPERLENYRKMKRELSYLSSRQHKSADRVEKERWKGVSLKVKAMKKKR